MKGVQGLMIAGCLGIIGAVCNWFYLVRQADNYERVALIAVKDNLGAPIELGQRFKESDFVKVEIPKNRLGNLEKVAVRWDALNTVIGFNSNREYFGGEIVMQQDLRTPAKEDLNKMIDKTRRVIWLPVDSRTFNPAHVNPDDLVSFRIPDFIAQPALANSDEPESTAGQSEIIGPFRILALGNRKGRREISKAAGLSVGAENVIAISVKVSKDGSLESAAQRLLVVLQRTNFQGVQLLLHSAEEAAE
ncbi:MAG: hypothetical protein CMJ78_19115 [Planctomycetaceae bacterium]|nr:hypothetical protein [Planctomycetaceae bacterium]